MERSTFKNSEGIWCIDGSNGKLTGDRMGRFFGEDIDRLAAYENTGLNPDEISAHESLYYEIITRTYGPLKQKISEWMEAERKGSLFSTPCQSGDEMYFLLEYSTGHHIEPFIVDEIIFKNDKVYLKPCGGAAYPLECCYKSPEEAERALRV